MTLEQTAKHYHDTLYLVQQAINSYSQSIGKLLQAVQRLENESLLTESQKWLIWALNNLIEIQRVTTQKEILIKQDQRSRIFTIDNTNPKLLTYQPFLINNKTQLASQENIVTYHIKIHPIYDNHSTTTTKKAPPLKPWLSQKVYRHIGSNLHKKQGGIR